MIEIISVVDTHNIPFIHSSADGHLGGFHNFTAINSAAVDTDEQVSLETNFEAWGKHPVVSSSDVWKFCL